MKTMAEMNNAELFNVLTGGNGVMAQYQLQKVIAAYRHQRKAQDTQKKADLAEMVRFYLEQEQN